MTRHVVWLGALSAAISIGCGGSTTPGEPAAAPESGGDAAAPESANAKGKEDARSLAEQRADFIATCAKKVPEAPDYCQCSWDLLMKIFTEEEMKSPQADPEKMRAYKEKLGPTCSGKVPEKFVHEKFITGCSGSRKQLTAYCECGYTELRKTLSPADLALGDADTQQRVEAAKKDMVKACGAKLPESIPRDDFMTSCLQSTPDGKQFCQCAWKQLRAAHSHAEIAAGLADVDAVKPKIDAACKKLHPKFKEQQ
jgi:hypothetical protein